MTRCDLDFWHGLVKHPYSQTSSRALLFAGGCPHGDASPFNCQLFGRHPLQAKRKKTFVGATSRQLAKAHPGRSRIAGRAATLRLQCEIGALDLAIEAALVLASGLSRKTCPGQQLLKRDPLHR
eukprot:TRINITY_DN11235_c0_g3_i2.p1 TRINITY_DN11235_c0_g3~~TRINITY_DN11235_c0_g3_i2.p1  ORF type:complete len:124 (-),score=10.11 TRINITY_DN11235_c0_g3_i2:367-738(-)